MTLLNVRSYKIEGIIIKRINSREADRILTILAKDEGKIKIIAKGVRKISSKRGGNLEIFNKIQAVVYSGSNFDSLIEVKTIDCFLTLRKNLEKISLAYYLCELVDNFCPEKQEQDPVFFLLEKALMMLDGQIKNSGYSVRKFEIELLKQLGYLNKEEKYNKINTSILIEELLGRKIKSQRFLKLVFDKI